MTIIRGALADMALCAMCEGGAELADARARGRRTNLTEAGAEDIRAALIASLDGAARDVARRRLRGAVRLWMCGEVITIVSPKGEYDLAVTRQGTDFVISAAWMDHTDVFGRREMVTS